MKIVLMLFTILFLCSCLPVNSFNVTDTGITANITYKAVISSYQSAFCKRVVDGDTIEVEIEGQEYIVRYIGIDTPETVHPSQPVEYMGKEASAKNKELVLNKKVQLEKDITDKDKYGRLLRYVYVDDVMVNQELVRLGYASVYTYPPDVKYVYKFMQAESEAKTNKRGLWK